ncbi:retropepsin-like aspartic protease [Acidomonas methanolica]|uniref:Lipoprotein n=1 Tax=Acidomonas methanolica NBRC 104435 TaxID=1231351 RepID=A0A023D4B7_ACIMT|nr:retropepsin-like aspartic protease [Acidomonas methanolica]MBU2654453.1 retroviral-like aspartic protease family protein [Acidomonas methanolica]TCS28256.1 hypothetical protein EDC31_10927 [Acidomonas methanolica]GAJ28610.1 hypothetical protein Amme_031_072 [Acidomonas methanolica NBRC 104435]GBQ53716.1 hypothetical protein AA0498_1991 [Acidomonas methanolica]GEK98973.1 hypothetical protein AME01nite_14720 [Acidomonas methanolica NBRC 104435]
MTLFPRKTGGGLLAFLLLAGCQPEIHEGIRHIAAPLDAHGKPPSFVPPPFPFDVEAETNLPAACLRHVLASELLNRNGAPTVPVRIDDEEGAAFLSPSEDMIGVFDGNDEFLELPDDGYVGALTLGTMETTRLTHIHELRMAQGHAENVEAMKLGTFNDKPGVTMGALAILGFDMLGNYDVLLDIPARRLTLFMPPDTPECRDLSRTTGPHSFRAPLIAGRTGVDNMVTVTLDGAPIGMHVEPSSNLSVLSEKDATADGLRRVDLDEGDRTNTLDGRMILGYRHRYRKAQIGSWHGGPFGVNVETVNYNLLGRDFFRHRKVLFAFRQGMMFFSGEELDTGPRDIGPGNLPPISSHIAHAAVRQ